MVEDDVMSQNWVGLVKFAIASQKQNGWENGKAASGREESS